MKNIIFFSLITFIFLFIIIYYSISNLSNINQSSNNDYIYEKQEEFNFLNSNFYIEYYINSTKNIKFFPF